MMIFSNLNFLKKMIHNFICFIREERNFLLLWVSRLISELGNSLTALCFLWWVLETYSVNVMSLYLICSSVPFIVSSLLFGSLVDMVNKKYLLIGIECLNLLTILTLSILFFLDRIQLSLIFILTIISSIALSFLRPAFQAIIGSIVAEKNLLYANSLSGFAGSLSLLVGPALGGFLYGMFSMAQILWFDVVSFAVGILLLVLIRHKGTRQLATKHVNILLKGYENLKDGFRYLKSYRTILYIILTVAVWNLFMAAIRVLIPKFIQSDITDGTSLSLGYLNSAISLGSLLASIMIILLPRTIKPSRLILAAILGCGFPFLLFTSIKNVPTSCFILGVYGFGTMVAAIQFGTLFQKRIAKEMQGRVFAVSNATRAALDPVGYYGTSLLFVYFAPFQLLYAIGYIFIALTVVFLLIPGFIRFCDN